MIIKRDGAKNMRDYKKLAAETDEYLNEFFADEKRASEYADRYNEQVGEAFRVVYVEGKKKSFAERKMKR